MTGRAPRAPRWYVDSGDVYAMIAAGLIAYAFVARRG